jgi:hypothetical protein
MPRTFVSFYIFFNKYFANKWKRGHVYLARLVGDGLRPRQSIVYLRLLGVCVSQMVFPSMWISCYLAINRIWGK